MVIISQYTHVSLCYTTLTMLNVNFISIKLGEKGILLPKIKTKQDSLEPEDSEPDSMEYNAFATGLSHTK